MRKSFEVHLESFKKTRNLESLEFILKHCCEDTADEKNFDEVIKVLQEKQWELWRFKHVFPINRLIKEIQEWKGSHQDLVIRRNFLDFLLRISKIHEEKTVALIGKTQFYDSLQMSSYFSIRRNQILSDGRKENFRKLQMDLFDFCDQITSDRIPPGKKNSALKTLFAGMIFLLEMYDSSVQVDLEQTTKSFSLVFLDEEFEAVCTLSKANFETAFTNLAPHFTFTTVLKMIQFFSDKQLSFMDHEQKVQQLTWPTPYSKILDCLQDLFHEKTNPSIFLQQYHLVFKSIMPSLLFPQPISDLVCHYSTGLESESKVADLLAKFFKESSLSPIKPATLNLQRENSHGT